MGGDTLDVVVTHETVDHTQVERRSCAYLHITIKYIGKI